MTHHVKDNDVYLLVVLVSEEHDDTPAFCRDVLCDDQLSEWVRANDVVVWGGNVADSESHTGISISLRVTNSSIKLTELYSVSVYSIDCKYSFTDTNISYANDTLNPH